MGGTPLYDESVVTLGTVVAKTHEFENAGVPVRTVTVIISDVADTSSRTFTADHVKAIVEDMKRAENHLVFFVGVEDGCTDFKAVAASMGIGSEFVLTPGNSPSEIRKAFAVVSKSAVRASQSAASFSKAAGGGFAA